MEEKYRIEHDTMGEIEVPEASYWGAQTERSRRNFIAGRRMPQEIIDAFAVLKKAAALTNVKLGTLDEERGKLISDVCDEILGGELYDHFPLVIYQTGSGTQSNMNANEVIANRGNEIKGEKLLHPNDHVNKSQSSNDTFPTAMHIAALNAVCDKVHPEAVKLEEALCSLEEEYKDVVKMGRTHLMDATPLTLGQEISGWRSMISHALSMIMGSTENLKELALGGTAVGTGLNAPEGFDLLVAKEISEITGKDFVTADNKFHSLTSKDALVYSHAALKALALNLHKIANDIRLLASGPRSGIGEITIPENEPGSSIMPGKVNPTQCEAVTMVSARVLGNDVTIGFAASQGQLQLNVYMPVLIDAFLESCNLLTDVMKGFREHCVVGIKPNEARIKENLDKSLMLVTSLSPHIGYEKAAEIAKLAHKKGITLKEAAMKTGYISETEFDEVVDPAKMV